MTYSTISTNYTFKNLTNALNQWENLLGKNYVITDEKQRLDAETATYQTRLPT